MVKYSFIIPHKNTPELLERCLNSIPVRDDLEIIVVDNNSSPNIVDIDNYPGKNRKEVLIIFDNNSIGAGGARNTGLKKAKGEWILFIDADDYYSDGFLNVLDLYSDQMIDVLFFDFNVLNGKRLVPLPLSLKYLKNFDVKDKNYVEKLRYVFQVPWNKMVRHDFIIDHNIVFEDCCDAANDMLYSAMVGYYARAIELNSTKLYNYILNNSSITHRKKYTGEVYVSQFKHLFQKNEFYRFVNRKIGRNSIIRTIAVAFIKRGVGQGFLSIWIFLKNYQEICASRFSIVNRLKDDK